MNQLVFIKDGKAVTDSLVVAQEAGKDHDDVLRDIRNQIAKLSEAGEDNFSLLNFGESTYTNERGREYPKFDLTEDAFAIVVMAYITPETMKFKIRFINEFRRMREQLQGLHPTMTTLEMLAQLAQQTVEKEKLDAERDREVRSLRSGLDTLTDNLTAVPDAAKVIDLINEYHRWSRLDHKQIYTDIYDVLLDQHGIDVLRRVEVERTKYNADYFDRTGKNYALKTLKAKVTGIDVMVRMGVLDKFHAILVGLLARAKGERKL